MAFLQSKFTKVPAFLLFCMLVGFWFIGHANDTEHYLPPNSFVSGQGMFVSETLEAEEEMTVASADRDTKSGAGFLSVLPPLLAIALAIITRQVILSLLIGCLSGLFILNGLSFSALGAAFFDLPARYLPEVLTKKSNISVIIFSLLISGMVALISKNGGIPGIVNKLQQYADNVRKTRLLVWFSGMLIFFDDYANTLLVGNSMRPLTDRFKISREKLAYIVDSTAAPLAAIAFITTWIGAQLGYIQEASAQAGITLGSYEIFLNSLAYAWYPVFALFLVFLVCWTGKDFEPMLSAEKSAASQKHDGTESKAEEFFRPVNAIIPIFILIAVVLGGLLYTGMQELRGEADITFSFWNIAEIMGKADAYVALLWGSFVSFIVAGILSFINSNLSLKIITEESIHGFNGITGAILILIFAWTLAGISEELGTAGFLADIMKGNIVYWLLPAAIFLLAAAVSFATGSSWGTMAILYPLFLPVSYQLSIEAGVSEEQALEIFFQVVAAVLGGSVFGDHCSPLSDTTILSSMSSGCDHIEHVRTQMPYALLGGMVSLIFGYIMVNLLPISWFVPFIVGGIVIWGILVWKGKKVNYTSV